MTVGKDKLRFSLRLPAPLIPNHDGLVEKCREALKNVNDIGEIEIKKDWEVQRLPSLNAPNTPNSLKGVKNIIAIASGKGGVGKSTVTVCIAEAFVRAGAKVGILDVDVYGPSIPNMVGLRDHQLGGSQQGVLEPVEAHGMKIMSMGFLANKDTPVVWRGPIASQLVQQFLGAVDWGELDYLFVDMPPGTGDIQLTLSQAVPLTGAVIVTTPQEVAHTIAEKGLRMFQQVKIPILGIVENMAGFIPPGSDEVFHIFGEGGGTAAAEEFDLPLLGKIAIKQDLREAMDKGTFVEDENIKEIASQIALQAMVVVTNEELSPFAPQEMNVANDGQTLIIKWQDDIEHVLSSFHVRGMCPCAHCVDEITGERLIKEGDIPANVKILESTPVGRYGVRFNFDDPSPGAGAGIYTFTFLRKLGEEAIEKASFEV
ncbi:MAG: P-loop NTPase [Gammaproteobacteria bacterium]|nr:P-loop NTPase [Gammaproteobacteria bacterium]